MNDMTSQNQAIISVQHTCADGWHQFTSEQVPGFYLIAEQDDLETAFGDIPVMLEHLIGADEGRKVTIKLEQTYSEYVEQLPDHFLPRVHHYSIEKLAA